MSSFSILIVEDEILIADTLARYLIKQGYQIVGMAISYEEAVALYQQHDPDIVLLDIRLNGPKTGIDFAYFLQQQATPPPFIYLTSQTDRRNIGLAKETFPAGYLSKPIQKESLVATIEIAMHNHGANQGPDSESSIRLSDGTTHYVIPIEEILYLQSDHVYVHVHSVGNPPLLQRGSLKELLDRFPEDLFVQTHRSYAVNIKHINRYDKQSVYINDQEVPVSRSRRKDLIEQLNQGKE